MTGRYASVAAVGRGVRILEILSQHPDGLSLTELAVALEAPAATVRCMPSIVCARWSNVYAYFAGGGASLWPKPGKSGAIRW